MICCCLGNCKMASHNYDVAAQNAALADTNHFSGAQGEDEEVSYLWSQKPRSLRDILKRARLPVVVKLCIETKACEQGTPVDLQQPFLLYKETKNKKLHARSLRTRPATRDVGQLVYKAIGPPITFPESFPGYFKLLDSGDQPLTSIAEVSRLMSKSFVSTEPCKGYICVVELTDTLYQKVSLPPGLYYSTSIFEGTIAYVNKRKAEKRKLLRCLTCKDDKGKVVLFPLDTMGIFYISEINEKFSRHVNIGAACRVSRWAELGSDKIKDGLMAKMVYGQAPEQESSQFTGLVEFKHVTEEHTVIGCTMTGSPRLFEMTITSEPLFIVSLNYPELESEPKLQRYIKFAKTECDNYMQAIKVKKDYNVNQTGTQA